MQRGRDLKSSCGEMAKTRGNAKLVLTLEEGDQDKDEESTSAEKKIAPAGDKANALLSAKPVEKVEVVSLQNLADEDEYSQADAALSEVEYRMNLDARKELTRLKTLAGVQGTFIHGWVDSQTKEGISNVVPELVKPSKSKCQKGFSFVAEEEIIQDNVKYILEAVETNRTFHDEVHTAGIAKTASEVKNPWLSMVISAAHTQEI